MEDPEDDEYEYLREEIAKEYQEWLAEHPRPGDDYMQCGCGKTDWCNKDSCG